MPLGPWGPGPYWLVRLLLKGVAVVYLIGFLVAARQFRPLAGEDGLLPLAQYVRRWEFRERPSLFYEFDSDRAIGVAAWTGVALSVLGLCLDECLSASDARVADQRFAFTRILESPEGVPLALLVKERCNVEAASDAPDGDYKRMQRAVDDLEAHGYVKTTGHSGGRWLEPATDAFQFTANKQDVKPEDGNGTEVDTARNVLAKRSRLSSDAQRGTLLQQLAAKRRATDDRYNVFRDRLDADNHLVVPYRTRFNSPSRGGEQRTRFGTAWDVAATGAEVDDSRIPADGLDVGQVWTLPVDPSRFDSLLAAAESLLADVPRFKSWVASRFTDGRQPSIVVVEFTDAGVIHAHVVLFGVGFLPHAAVSHYWGARRDCGEVVYYDPIRERGGTWIWADGRPGSDADDDRRPAESRGPRAYLGKTLADAASLASASADDVQAAASALRAESTDATDGSAPSNGDVSDTLADAQRWWKLALYFATDTRFFTCSPTLKPDDDNDSLPYVPRWEYVGTARFSDLPGHMQRTATVVRRRGRPPPAAASSAGGSADA
jgi:hypothetical protein